MSDPCLPLARAIAELETLVPEPPPEEPEKALQVMTATGVPLVLYDDDTMTRDDSRPEIRPATRPAAMLHPASRAVIGCALQPTTWRKRVRRWGRLQRVGLRITLQAMWNQFE